MPTKSLHDSSWTPDALDVVKRACEHYGGTETWNSLHRIRLIPRQLSGLIPWLKGYGRTFRFPVAFEIAPHARRVKFVDYPDEEHVGVFQNGSVWFEHCATSKRVAFAEDHRLSFRGLRKNRRWTPIDALYFFGYALAHYHSLPFTLLDGQLIRTSRKGSKSALVTVLDIQLPEDLPTHCRRQRFHFGKDGKILRHDYHAEVVGPWARGAHLWNRETLFNGFPLSLERRVVARLGSIPSPITALHATFRDAEVDLKPSAAVLTESPHNSGF